MPKQAGNRADQARWKDQRKAAGLIRVEFWVHPEDRQDLKRLADELKTRRLPNEEKS